MTTLVGAGAAGEAVDAAVARRPPDATLTGTARLVRFVLRRDRVRLAVWLLALGGVLVASAASLPPVYPDQAAIESYVRLFGDNPALVAFAGPGYGFDDPNIGVILVNETQLWSCIAVALMSIFLLNRHTRAEEDEERTDVLRSNVVGRHAPTTAAVIVVTGANVVLAVGCAVAFVALGYPVAGSIALAGSFLATGLVFVGVTAVAAQVANTGRATLALASVVLGVAFVLRALGDIGGNLLTWLSPIGWAQGVRAFADERWWTLVLCLVVAAGLVVLAFWLSTVRDVGSGLVPSRPGDPRASRALLTPIGLAVRLQRAALAGWVVGLLAIGAVYGSIGQDVEAMIEENPVMADFMAQIGEADVTDAYFATSMALQGMLAAGFAISSVLRLRSEEQAGRAELVLAGPEPRAGWAAGHLAVAALGTVVVVGAGGLGMGLAYAAVAGDAGQVARLTGAALVTVPGVWLLAGVAVALFGLAPRAALAAWGALALIVGVGLFGQILRLPEWTLELSPFEHLPAVPADPMAWTPFLAVTTMAVALVAAGLWGLARRDLHSS